MSKNTLAYRFRHAAERAAEPVPVPVFDTEENGSPTLRTLFRRLEELKWEDAEGVKAFEELKALEAQALPKVSNAHDWLDKVGDSTPDDWDDFTYHARGRA
tara:strand:- start:765 stop:1067 length:303 start_codon:yes stop_codon:yes gene_type:complete